MSDDKKSDYFNMSDALDEFNHQSFGAGEKTVAGLKMFGKGLFNAAKFAATEVLPAAAKQAARQNVRTSEELLKRDDLSEDKRTRLEETKGRAEHYLEEQERKIKEKEDQEDQEKEEIEKNAQANIASSRKLAEEHERAKYNSASAAGKDDSSRILDTAQDLTLESTYVKDASSVVTSDCANFKLDQPRLIDYLHKIEVTDSKKQRIFVGDNIPADKIQKALLARREYVRNGKVLLLVDDTVFCSGKDGLLVTEEYISFKKAFGDSNDYSIKFLGGLTIPEGFTFNIVEKNDADLIFEQLSAFLADRIAWHENAAANGDVESQFFLSAHSHGDREKQYYWLIMAARGGNSSAQNNFGMALKSIAPDQACHWFKLAAEQGNTFSAKMLKNLQYNEAENSSSDDISSGMTMLIDKMSAEQINSINRNIDADTIALHRALQRVQSLDHEIK